MGLLNQHELKSRRLVDGIAGIFSGGMLKIIASSQYPLFCRNKTHAMNEARRWLDNALSVCWNEIKEGRRINAIKELRDAKDIIEFICNNFTPRG